MAIPFPQPPNGGHILGQPFTLSNLSIPVNATLACNCTMPPSELQIVASAPTQCPRCRKAYIVVFNPQNGQIQVAIAAEAPQVVS